VEMLTLDSFTVLFGKGSLMKKPCEENPWHSVHTLALWRLMLILHLVNFIWTMTPALYFRGVWIGKVRGLLRRLLNIQLEVGSFLK